VSRGLEGRGALNYCGAFLQQQQKKLKCTKEEQEEK